MTEYKVFISFPREERVFSEDKTKYTREYYFSMHLYDILEHLLNIHTFFSPVSLLERNKTTYDKEIEKAIEESTIFISVSIEAKNEGRTWVNKERDDYIKSRNGREALPYFIFSRETIKIIEDTHIFKDNHSVASPYYDMHRIAEMLSYIEQKVGDGSIKDIKICNRCHRIFHDGNEKGTTCLYHPLKPIEKEDEFIFECCNRHTKREDKEGPMFFPGCKEAGEHDF